MNEMNMAMYTPTKGQAMVNDLKGWVSIISLGLTLLGMVLDILAANKARRSG